MPKALALRHLFVFQLFLAAAAGSAPASGAALQSPRFERITIEHGLSQNSIIWIMQDRLGYLWFGTEDGLNRYDGYRFTVFRHDPNDPTSLGRGYVSAIFEDRRGRLWVGTEGGGLNRFDADTQTFVRYVHDPNDPRSLSTDVVNRIYEARDGTLWVATNGGLNRRGPNETGFTRYVNDPDHPQSLASDMVYAILEDASGALWVGTEGGLQRFHRERETFESFACESNASNNLRDNDVRYLLEDERRRLWVATYGGGLIRMDPHRACFTRYLDDRANPYSIGSNDINVIHEDPFVPGTLWLGTRGAALVRLDVASERFVRYKNDPSNPFSISNDRVSSVLHTRSGTLWAGTYDEGANKLHRNHARFLHYVHDPDDPWSLSDSFVRSIAEDRDGNVWLGTYDGGLNRLGPARERAEHYRHDPEDRTSISSNEVRHVYVDGEGFVWAGTYHGGLNRLDPERGTFQRFLNDPSDPRTLSDNRVMAVREDAHGRLWVGTEDGLNRLDRERGTFTRYFHDPADSTSINYDRIYELFLDRSGELWVATLGGGLARYDSIHDSFERYTNEPGNPDSLPADFVLSLHEDEAGTLWVGTLGGGLARLDRSRGKFTSFTTRNGLPNDVIHSILEDDQGRLWLGTNQGLARFDPETGESRNYDTNDGLLTNEFAAKSYLRTADGHLAFGTIAGLTIFDPDSLSDNLRPPPIVLTDFQSFNESVRPGPDSFLEKPISLTDEIVLSYRQSVFSFEFAALDDVAPAKNQYAYKMEGFDADWNYVEDRRFATYTNLDPGEYVFSVKGSNSDGIWNEEGLSVRLVITPPFWRTWWAYTFYALAMYAALYGARRYELNRIRLRDQVRIEQLEAAKLKELDRMKSRFFANISHEFRTPLALILGPVQDLMQSVTKAEWRAQLRRVERNGERLLRLINQLLDLSRLEAGKMELRAAPGDIVSFARGVTMAFSSMAERKEIRLSFHTNPEAVELYFDRDKVEDILINLLSNAFKFTERGGRIEVSVEGDDDFVELSVKDTGAGIAAEALPKIFDRFYQVDGSATREHEGSGIGLSLVHELVRLHRGSVRAVSELDRGSTFIVRLPLGTAHLELDEIVPKSGIVETRLVPSLPFDQVPVVDESRSERDEDVEIVLVVEDNADLRAYMRERLELEFVLLEAADGAEGLELARAEIPDLIVSDVMMPRLDGYQLCRALKTDERTSHIPVVLLTAKADRDEKLEGLESGADDYLTKPFDMRELVARIRNLTSLRRKLRQRFSQTVLLQPSELGVSSVDEAFLTKALTAVEENLQEEDFSVETLGRQLGLSRSQLHRKLKALTNQSPTHFIRSIRLQRASELLGKKAGNVAEIAYRVGFSSQAYFTKCFHEHFGCTPTEYARGQR